MKERPILFAGPMVKAILEGHKTQTRRVIKPQPIGEPRPLREWVMHLAHACGDDSPKDDAVDAHIKHLKGRVFPFTTGHEALTSPSCPYGQPGDRLWVRETWRIGDGMNPDSDPGKPTYRADWPDAAVKWKSAIYLPRKLSRITLEIVSVRPERLQEISEEDAIAEGVRRKGDSFQPSNYDVDYYSATLAYKALWDSINGKPKKITTPTHKPITILDSSWVSNPWVWRIEFKVIERGQDAKN